MARVVNGSLTVTAGGVSKDRISILGPLTSAGSTWLAVVSDRKSISPQLGCEAVDSNRVSCDIDGITDVAVSTGDGDDWVAVFTDVPTVVHGGAGSDYLSDEGTGGNELWGDGGQDSLLGGAGDDKLYGGDSGDSLTGGAGDDLMEGGAGYDVFYPSSAAEGTDVMRGGEDDDRVDYSRRTAPVIVTLDGVVNDGEPGEKNVIAEIEDVRGGRGNDRLIGDEFDNSLDGGPGNDHLEGRGGDDVLAGNAGDDYLDAGEGNDSGRPGPGKDVVLGGAGEDRLSLDEFDAPDNEPDILDGGPGKDEVNYSSMKLGVAVSLDGLANDGKPGESDNVLGAEDVIGSWYADVLIGDAGNNLLDGGEGDDTIDGGAGTDRLEGRGGNDTLRAVDGVGSRDYLDGGFWNSGGDPNSNKCEADSDDIVYLCELTVVE